MNIKFELTIDVQPGRVGYLLKYAKHSVSGFSFMGSGTDNPIESVMHSVTAQIKTTIEDRLKDESTNA